MAVKVSAKYQVVIPEAVRRSMNIKPGMKVSVIVKDGIACIIPIKNLNEIQKNFRSLSSIEKRRMQESLREKKDRNI